MLPAQKQAWFTLAVIGVTAVVVVALAPLLGRGAMGGFGILGLTGFRPLFYRKKGGQVLADERDALIQSRALIAAYTVFWMVFVAAGVLAPIVYRECVPSWLVGASVWGAFMLFLTVLSLATLAQYGRGE
jgi:hypothetical protein